MGESVAEATLTAWLKEVGDAIELDEPIFEIATDKVDSEVPSEVEGVLLEKRFAVDDVIKVGEVVALIQVAGEDVAPAPKTGEAFPRETEPEPVQELQAQMATAQEAVSAPRKAVAQGDRFYSPLVRNIAREEGISQEELDAIPGTGKEGRVTKNDIKEYLQARSAGLGKKEGGAPVATTPPPGTPVAREERPKSAPIAVGQGDEIVPLSRMGKLIAQHMVDSVATSAHVQSFVEVDVTKVVQWRERVKRAFEAREGEKLTFTPIFMEAVALALKKFPMMNISLDGDRVIKKKNINLGMAAALPDGNLIVPVIKNADQLNLVGMAKTVNDLANRARLNQLRPDEIKEGTYTVTNVGSFGSVFGTPIINQPQVGILALGAIRKLPSVIETDQGEYIGIRSKMFLSHSYDHRVVNGALGGMFVKAVAEYLEAWDPNREI